MRKYRVLQVGNIFYPQEKRFLCWRYIDGTFHEFTWSNFDKDRSECESLLYAKGMIKKRKEFLLSIKQKPIIHNEKN